MSLRPEGDCPARKNDVARLSQLRQPGARDKLYFCYPKPSLDYLDGLSLSSGFPERCVTVL